MTRLQFGVLYREFLFRMVDLELLSPQCDMSRLLGQFATILVLLSIGSSLPLLTLDPHLSHEALHILLWNKEHSLISLTMLVVGLFAVLSWDSTFPDKRDVLVLAPLPVRTHAIFVAKVAAAASALSITVVALNIFPGLLWPLATAPANAGFLELIFSPGRYQAFAAYWLAMLAAGTFIFGSVLCVQGLAAHMLPRRLFLRFSALLQMGAFCWFLCAYFLEPPFAAPTYWFAALLEQLNGSIGAAELPLAHRAWAGLAVVISGSAATFALSYFRTIQKIAEEPDIVPGARGRNWLPSFGNALQTAVLQFSIRTLLRSRQHRVILAFYFGLGFAFAILLSDTPRAREQMNVPLLLASIIMMCVAVMGTRIVFSIPLTLHANWVFRLTPIRGGRQSLAASRLSLFLLAVAPVWLVAAFFFFSRWTWLPAAGHLLILALIGAIAVEASLYGFSKIPFTCSYLPGKSYFHMAFLAFMSVIFLLNAGAALEAGALKSSGRYVTLVALLLIALSGLCWRTQALAESRESSLRFEEEVLPALQGLGLQRDGILPGS